MKTTHQKSLDSTNSWYFLQLDVGTVYNEHSEFMLMCSWLLVLLWFWVFHFLGLSFKFLVPGYHWLV